MELAEAGPGWPASRQKGVPPNPVSVMWCANVALCPRRLSLTESPAATAGTCKSAHESKGGAEASTVRMKQWGGKVRHGKTPTRARPPTNQLSAWG